MWSSASVAVLATFLLFAPLSSCNPVELQSRAIDYSIPSTWRSPTTSRSLDNRKAISKAAATRMLSLKGSFSNQNIGNLGYWPSANAWTEIVTHDFSAGTRDFIGTSLDAVGDTFGQFPAFHANDFNDDTMWWGFAAIYQYRTYNDATALSWARANWDNILPYQVTGTSNPRKSFTWPANCNARSTSGGVFWRTTAGDTYVNAITTTLFVALSAHLYDLTGETRYKDAADRGRAYIRNHLINANGMVLDGMNVQTCGKTDWVFTYNQGKYIEGLVLLYGKSGNTEYLDEAVNLAVISMKSSGFQGADGIITEGQNQPYNTNDDGRNFKGIYLRGLAVLYRRSPSGHAIRALIRAYTNVQANALIDLASNNPANPSIYGVNWHGPMDAGYAWGQLAALDALAGFASLN